MTQFFKRIDTVFLPVTDIERSIDWYTTRLGLKLRWHLKEHGYAALDIAEGETPMTLVQVASDQFIAPKSEPFNFYSPNIQLTYEAFKQAGIEVSTLNEDGVVTFFQFKDPDGNPLGVCYFEEK